MCKLDEITDKIWNDYFSLNDIERYVLFARTKNPDAGLIIEDGTITAIEC